MTYDWIDIERRLGLRDAQSFARNVVEPCLRDVVAEPDGMDGAPDRMQLPTSVGFVVFLVLFFFAASILPNNFVGEVLKFILFPLLFLASIAGSFFVFKDRFIGLFLAGRDRFLLRSKALTAIAERLGLTYVPSPGGAPELLKRFAKWKFAPKELQEIATFLDDHGGMDDALADVRRSGIMAPSVAVLASVEQKEKYLKQYSEFAQVEDGFQGSRNGVAFNAFEWIESVEDAPNVHHLALVMTAPTRLYGVTQFRTKGATWPTTADVNEMKQVGLGVPEFEKRFRLRSTDQVEARVIFNPAVIERAITLAHDETLRAVAFDDLIIFDVAGENRFEMVDLATGAWSEASIHQTFANIAEMLELVDAVAHAFMLRAKSA
ncbi:MAG: DUF3137 domain-containing protein [Marinicaulis sp.]|nr:DUF3137 domain-containing protein [Marinicaulis sp.]